MVAPLLQRLFSVDLYLPTRVEQILIVQVNLAQIVDPHIVVYSWEEKKLDDKTAIKLIPASKGSR